MAKKTTSGEGKNPIKNSNKSEDNQADSKTNSTNTGNPEEGIVTDKEEHQKEEHSSESATESINDTSTMEKLAEMQDKYIRLSAEFDNYRKRTLKEKIELTKTAAESILLKLLPVLDDFERGVKLMESATDCKAMKEGIDLIYSKFRFFLDQSGVKEIESLNCEFDVDLHDAVTKVPAPDKKLKGKVVDVLEKGYMLNDKVIRFSKVVVGE